MSRAFGILFSGLLGIAGLVTLLVMNATAREVAFDAFSMLFAIVTTPFILESTIAIGFVMALMLFNRWRLSREGDGWVYLVSQEPDTGVKLPGTATQRLQGVVMEQMPEKVDEAQTERSLIEGYLELGMAAQAREELEAMRDLPDDATTALLRVRVLAANLDNGPAQTLLRSTVEKFPECHAMAAMTVADICAWFAQHLPGHGDQSEIWQGEARRLGVLNA